jgi:hypothetical protein
MLLSSDQAITLPHHRPHTLSRPTRAPWFACRWRATRRADRYRASPCYARYESNAVQPVRRVPPLSPLILCCRRRPKTGIHSADVNSISSLLLAAYTHWIASLRSISIGETDPCLLRSKNALMLRVTSASSKRTPFGLKTALTPSYVRSSGWLNIIVISSLRGCPVVATQGLFSSSGDGQP